MLAIQIAAALLAGGYAAWFLWDWRGSAHARHTAGREPWCDGGRTCSMKVHIVIGLDYGRLGTTLAAVAKMGDAFHVLGIASGAAVRSAADFERQMQKVAAATRR